MRIQALATDYDGTIADAGLVSERTIAALEAVRQSGRRLVLISGRQLRDLIDIFPKIQIFDSVVAENGAVLFDPAIQETVVLGEPPPAALLAELARRGVPIDVGAVVVATGEPHQVEVMNCIRDLGLEWDVVFNKGAVMALPSGVNKASGLLAALERMHLSAHNVAGIGDAENDHSFLRLCEVAIAVGNALPAIKQRADLVMRSADGRGVEQFIRRFLLNDLAEASRAFQRYTVELGVSRAGAPMRLPVHGERLLILGSSGSGKSTLSGVLTERLVDQGYQVCVVDPEGDHEALDPLVVIGSAHAAPSLDEVEMALERAPAGLVVNLVAVGREHVVQFAASLLTSVAKLRAGLGRPHWLVLDEAHHVLPALSTPTEHAISADFDGLAMITVDVEALPQSALDRVSRLLVTGGDADGQVRQFARRRRLQIPDALDRTAFELFEGEAASVDVRGNVIRAPRRFRVGRRRTEHRRHARKYARGDLGEDKSFYFRGPLGRLNLRAYNVHAFVEMARGVDEETWAYHLNRGDVSTWFEEQIKDAELAEELRSLERAAPRLGGAKSREQALRLIDSRYSRGE